MNAAIERMIVEGMVIKRKRERALFELSHPQKRDHFLGHIEQYLEPSLFHRIIVDSPQDAYSLLKSAARRRIAISSADSRSWTAHLPRSGRC